jgi:hypothetical protein
MAACERIIYFPAARSEIIKILLALDFNAIISLTYASHKRMNRIERKSNDEKSTSKAFYTTKYHQNVALSLFTYPG